mmetsp:Transcript_40583/g.90206  ORF Transcript_40583/g.90206 Transcript_40583/m.90206 type:complete len:249 (+) Transcript_40583:2417-3163(+)
MLRLPLLQVGQLLLHQGNLLECELEQRCLVLAHRLLPEEVVHGDVQVTLELLQLLAPLTQLALKHSLVTVQLLHLEAQVWQAVLRLLERHLCRLVLPEGQLLLAALAAEGLVLQLHLAARVLDLEVQVHLVSQDLVRLYTRQLHVLADVISVPLLGLNLYSPPVQRVEQLHVLLLQLPLTPHMCAVRVVRLLQLQVSALQLPLHVLECARHRLALPPRLVRQAVHLVHVGALGGLTALKHRDVLLELR